MSQIAVESMPDLAASDVEKSTMRAVSWRLLPFLIVAYFTCVLDRVNVSFAALTMNADLGFTPLVYAWGAGIFFIGYFLLEVPSNIALHRFGAQALDRAHHGHVRGLISAATAFVTGPTSFYTIRFLLGVAGSRLLSRHHSLSDLSGIRRNTARVSCPLSSSARRCRRCWAARSAALLLEMHNIGGFKGWQWLFLVEGIMPVLLGFVAFFYLTDKPAAARWLTSEQKDLARDGTPRQRTEEEARRVNTMTLREALSSPKVLALGFIYFGLLSRALRNSVLAAADRQRLRAHEHPDRVRQCDTVRVRNGGDAAVGPAPRQGKGARSGTSALPLFLTAASLVASAYAGNLVLDDGCIGARQYRWLRGVSDCSGRCRTAYLQRRGGSWRNCPDQFDRQSLGLRRAVSDRLDQGSQQAAR